MIYFTARFVITGEIHWHYKPDREDKDDEININFYYYKKLKRRDAISKVKEDIAKNNIQWLTLKGNKWIFNLALLKEQLKTFEKIEWLKGKITVEPEVEIEKGMKFGEEIDVTRVSYYVTKELVNMNSPTKIFLSHKGSNKSLVRDFDSTLKILGFDTWLDEDAMHAGVEVERSILQGFKDSCAAVFFITPEFKDENYLATEINYAIAEKREKGNKFSIITLVFKDETENVGEVPPLLKPYKWKEPDTQLEAIREIIKALPIKSDSVEWKEN
jgi:TIR domain